MKTAIVILNWNTEGFLKRFLPGLLHSVQDEDAEVIVADNASTDGSIAMMKEFFPHVRTITSEKNLGFTGGYNIRYNRTGKSRQKSRQRSRQKSRQRSRRNRE